MIINWYGEGCFKIQTGGLTLISDPFESSIGLTPPRGKTEIILKTLTPWPMEEPADAKTAEEGKVIRGGGEYEIQGIEITGFPISKESNDKFLKTIYRVRWEELTLVFLGHISGAPEPVALEWIDEPDILVLPVEGGHYLSTEAAAKLAKQSEASIIVPIFHTSPYTFLKTFGQKAEPQEKFVFRKKDLEKEKGKVILLESAS